MATTLFSTLYPDILPYVPGCSELLVDQHLIRAARMFCRDSQAWRHNIPLITVAKNVSEYTLPVPPGADVSQIKSVSFKGSPVAGKDTDWLDANVPNWETSTSNSPKYYTTLARGKIRLVYTPSITTGQGLKVRVSLIPESDATGMDAEVIEEWGEVIAAETLNTLLRMKDKPWFDRIEAGRQMTIFIRGKRQAAAKANLSRVNGSLRVKPVSIV